MEHSVTPSTVRADASATNTYRVLFISYSTIIHFVLGNFTREIIPLFFFLLPSYLQRASLVGWVRFGSNGSLLRLHESIGRQFFDEMWQLFIAPPPLKAENERNPSSRRLIQSLEHHRRARNDDTKTDPICFVDSVTQSVSSLILAG